MLADIRFKLLAFVPTASALAVTVVKETATPEVSLLVGSVEVLVTTGIIIYELRNTQFYDADVHRAKSLEVLLGFPVCTKGYVVGGLFSERPGRPRLWKIQLWHDLGLALVYGAAFGAWIYLILDSLFALTGQRSFAVSLLLAAIAGIDCALTFLYIGGHDKPQRTEEIEALTRMQ